MLEVWSIMRLFVLLAGATAGTASDAFPSCRDSALLAARQRRRGERLDDARGNARWAWSETVAGYRVAGVVANPFEFAQACPNRYQVGGFGRSRLLGISSRPAPLRLWLDLNAVPPAH